MAIRIIEFDTIDELKQYQGKDIETVNDKEQDDFESETEIEPQKVQDIPELYRGDGESWTEAQDNYLIDFYNKNIEGKKRLQHGLYEKIEKVLNRTKNGMKARIHLLKKEGRLDDVSTRQPTIPQKPDLEQSKLRKAWKKGDIRKLKKLVKECLNEGLTSREAKTKIAKQMDRSFMSIHSALYQNRINYLIRMRQLQAKSQKAKPEKVVVVIPKKAIKKDGKKWREPETNHLIEEVRKETEKYKVVRAKTYKKLSEHLGRNVSAVKSQVSKLRQNGILKYASTPEIRKQRTEKILIEKAKYMDKKKEVKDKSNEGYMHSRTPTVPRPTGLYGKIKEFVPLFSLRLSEQQNDLLKAMIQNDISNHGISKLNEAKISYIADMNHDEYEDFITDVAHNSAKIKAKMNLKLIQLTKEGTSDVVIFS